MVRPGCRTTRHPDRTALVPGHGAAAARPVRAGAAPPTPDTPVRRPRPARRRRTRPASWPSAPAARGRWTSVPDLIRAVHPGSRRSARGGTELTYGELWRRSGEVAAALAAAGVAPRRRRGGRQPSHRGTAGRPARRAPRRGRLPAGRPRLPGRPDRAHARRRRPACVLADDAGARSLPPHDLPTVRIRTARGAGRARSSGRTRGRRLGALHVRLDRAAQGRASAPTRRSPTGCSGPATPGPAEVRVAKSSTELHRRHHRTARRPGRRGRRGGRRRARPPTGRHSPAGRGAGPPSCSPCPAWPPRSPRPRRSSCAACAGGSPAARPWTRRPSPRCGPASPGAEVVNSYGSSEVAGDVLAGGRRRRPPVTLGRPVPGARIMLLDAALEPGGGRRGRRDLRRRRAARARLPRPGRAPPRPGSSPTRSRPASGSTAPATSGRWTPATRWSSSAGTTTRSRSTGTGSSRPRWRPRCCAGSGSGRRCVVTAAGAVAARVRGAGSDLDPDGLLATLREELPGHLVPATVTVLDRVPLLPNGKRDRRALPDPRTARRSSRRAPPRERLVCDLFARCSASSRSAATTTSSPAAATASPRSAWSTCSPGTASC